MHNITLICTVHGESGSCNLDSLYKIIETINPEVIFEEMPPSAVEDYYINKTVEKLESKTIIKYLETHNIEHIPVDIDIITPSFLEKNRFMHSRVESNSFEYRRLIDNDIQYRYHYGFDYLNSRYCGKLYKELNEAIEVTVHKLKEEKLIKNHNQWNEIEGRREDEMLKNIYNYCAENIFDIGIFFIGAFHRESIIRKIQKYEESSDLKINWNYSNYDNILDILNEIDIKDFQPNQLQNLRPLG